MRAVAFFEDFGKALDEFFVRYGDVIAKAWQNKGLYKKLIRDPRGTLESQGIVINGEYDIVVEENSTQIVWDYQTSRLTLPIPPRPEGMSELSVNAGPSRIDCFSVSRIDCFSAGGSEE